MSKKQRQDEERIKQAIMKGRDRGVCNSEGESVKDSQGRPVAKPRILGNRARKL